ncbi:MAG: hypothetical protein WHT29_08310, partial [Bacteroidales bacterium]
GWDRGGHPIATKRATPTGLEGLKFLGSYPPKDRLILKLAYLTSHPSPCKGEGKGVRCMCFHPTC